MTGCFIRWFMLILALPSLPVIAQPAGQFFFAVPNELKATEGNDASRLPFGYPYPVHYQQVYDASQFSQVPAGGAYLTRIFFRADCSSTRDWLVTNVQVSLSTTVRSPDGLSAEFALNTGVDQMIVYGPKNYITPPGSSIPPCPQPRTFATGDELNLDVPFFYDPARGNLLMDLRNSGNNWKSGDPLEPLDANKLDSQTVLGDSISRVAAYSLTTNMAEVIDTSGLVTAFQFDSIPSLTNSLTTNSVVITWPTLPNTFVLQWTDKLGTNTAWNLYTNTVISNGFYRTVEMPLAILKSLECFRLAWESGRTNSAFRRSGVTGVIE